MKRKKILCLLVISMLCLTGFTGCADKKEEKEEADFSAIQSVCELATLKCYYHNVAKSETEASGLFKWFGTGYKKIWTEYSGIVELGVDVSKVSVSKPSADGVVKVTIPDAEILSVDLDEDSMGEPLTDTGFMTKITKEEETEALAEAQNHMEETAKENGNLLNQAKERAKSVIEGYIKNVGEQIGKEYTVEWIDAKAEE